VTELFLPLPDHEALDAALARSVREPILIFKHSATCGISAQALHELSGWLESRPQPSTPVYLVHVRHQRAVSTEIAERFGIRHESPQLLLVERGGVRWHGSHWHVNAPEVQAAVETLAASAGQGQVAEVR
jgi:bacillithiol system protein YtxJ